MFDPVADLDRVVEEALVSRFDLAYPSTLLLWDASVFCSLLEGKGALSLVSTRRAFKLRTYVFMQGSAEVLQTCPWCECHTWSMIKHARGGCPVLDTRLLAASYLVAHAVSAALFASKLRTVTSSDLRHLITGLLGCWVAGCWVRPPEGRERGIAATWGGSSKNFSPNDQRSARGSQQGVRLLSRGIAGGREHDPMVLANWGVLFMQCRGLNRFSCTAL